MKSMHNKVVVMNNNQNTRLDGSSREKRKGKGRCSFECVAKILNALTLLCSFIGISLFSAIFFGLTDILDYSSIKLMSECAYGLVISSIIIFFLEHLVLRLKRNSRENNLNPVLQVPVGGKMLLVPAAISPDDSKLVDCKLKTTTSNTEIKQDISGKSKPTTTSSTCSKLSEENTKKETTARTSSSKNSPKNLRIGPSKHEVSTSKLSPNILSKTFQKVGISKQEDTLIADITPKTPQHTDSHKKGEIKENLSPNVASKSLLQSVKSKQKDNESAKFNEKLSHGNLQLVPYKKQAEFPFRGQNVPAVPSPYRVPNLCNILPPNTTGCSPTTEITATKRTTIFPWGSQEEYQVLQRTFYPYPSSPGGGISHQFVPSQTLDYDQNKGFPQKEYGKSGSTPYQYPRYPLGGISSQNILRQNLPYGQNRMTSAILNQSQRNRVSDFDMQKKFEGMNFFH